MIAEVDRPDNRLVAFALLAAALGGICGRRAFGKRFLLVMAAWLIAGICSAYLGGVVQMPLAIMRFAR